MQQVDLEETKSTNFLAIACTFFMIAAAALSYVTFNNYFNGVTLSKAKFICTKIEQVGKNMDDVVCTQYTHQKYSKEAVALNQLVTK